MKLRLRKFLVVLALSATTFCAAAAHAADPSAVVHDPALIEKRNAAIDPYNEGVNLFKSGKYQEAATKFSKSVEVDPTFPQAYLNRAVVREELGDLQGALSDYDQAITLLPEFAQAFNGRSLLNQRLGNTDASIADVTKAIALAPTNPNFYANRAAIYLTVDNQPGAKADVLAALKLNPQHAQALNSQKLLGHKTSGIHSTTQFVNPGKTEVTERQKAIGITLRAGLTAAYKGVEAAAEKDAGTGSAAADGTAADTSADK